MAWRRVEGKSKGITISATYLSIIGSDSSIQAIEREIALIQLRLPPKRLQ
jgi:hypothetical protein